MPKEMCTNCDEETGRAGIGEDSMYPVLAMKWGMLEKGDMYGPLCEECNLAMSRLEMIDHEA